jgi:broad specificity phosphatase PhoE
MNTNAKAPVYLLRHARTSLNADGRLRGHLDPPLDDVGRAEAAALAAALSTLRPVRIYSSPLRRAVETATALSAHLDVDVVTDERLIDRDYGPWAGSTEGDVISEYGSFDDAPGVEPAAAVRARARELLDSVVDALDDGPVVLVAHDAVNRALLADLAPTLAADGPIAQHTACWNVLLRDGDGWRVEQVNQVAAA